MKLLTLTSHPIQYYSPLYRVLARTHGLSLHVSYFSDVSIRGAVDAGFGRSVAWDVPLLEGYPSSFELDSADLRHSRTFGLGAAIPAIRRHAPDAVLIAGYMYGFELEALAYCSAVGIPVVMRGEFTNSRPEYRRPHRILRESALRAIYARVGAFGVIGSGARSHLLEHGVASERLFESPYFVDSETLTAPMTTTSREMLRAELALPHNRFTLLFSGKLIERKGVDVLLRALANPTLEGTTLLVVGSGPLEAEYRGIAKQLPPGREVRFCGFVNQSNLYRYFGAADAFVLPSRYETWGLVANEALHFGVPIVLSDHVGSRHDLVRPGLGAVFASENPESLAAAIAEVRASEHPGRAEACRALVAGFSADRAAQGLCLAVQHAAKRALG
jgi:glycosyltransferase involved in cell wall biosynthesis